MRQQNRAKDLSPNGNVLLVVRSTELGSRVLFCAAAKAARRVVNSSVKDSMMNEMIKLQACCFIVVVNECKELYGMTMRWVVKESLVDGVE